MKNLISIEPVEVWTSDGKRSADKIEVRGINYNGETAMADCHLWDSKAEVEVGQFTGNANQKQCDEWADNDPFYAEIAKNAGLVPI